MEIISRSIIEKVIFDSLNDLNKYDSILLNPLYNINERTVSHRLAIYIENHICNKLDVDVEYNRMQKDNINMDDVGCAVGKIINWENSDEGKGYVYPDIIIHKRNTNINIAAIEIKMSWKNRLKKIDYDKVSAYVEQLN